MSPATDFWRGKRVFVTGHTGFKGAWLCHQLLRAGSEVMGYSLPPPHEPSLFALTRLEDDVRHTTGDVRDLEALRRSVETFKPQIAFHLAAQSLVLESYRDPVGTFATNVMGTVNVLEALRSAGDLQACVIVTSDKCYEDRGPHRAHREDDRLGGDDPYSASKACAELVTAAYGRSFYDGDARVASARAGNVIGGGDWSDDRLIPDTVRALTGRTTLELRNPDAVRPWQHVLEPLAGYLRLAERLVADPGVQGGWNFGPGSEEPWRVRDIVGAFADAWGDESGTDVSEISSPWAEAPYLSLDSSKARERLDWAPRWDVRTAIERTVRWYHSFYAERATAASLVDADLEEYSVPSRLEPAAADGTEVGA